MKLKHSYAILAVVFGCLLTSCHSDLDLNNVDPKAQINMGLALPVGALNVTMGDILGTDVDPLYVDEYGNFHVKARFDIPTKEYHSIDVKDYIIKNTSTLVFNIGEKVPLPYIMGDGSTTVELPFPLELGMQGINDHTTDERIDSIWITQAIFNSWINVQDFDLRWNEIKSVKLYLDSTQFRRESMVVNIPIADKGFNQKIDIRVDEFTLSLLKDAMKPSEGTVDKIKFKIAFELCLDAGHMITISPSSQIRYDLGVEVIDYDAIWGFFEAGTQMSSKDVVCLEEVWDAWKDFKKLKLRFAAPKIDVYVTHHVAAPLIMHIDYIRAADKEGHSQSATWNGEDETNLYLDEYMSPLTETLQDSVIHHKVFSNKAHEGKIDELFDVRPDSFLYSFYLLVDQNKLKYDKDWSKWQQLRITKDTRVTGHADIDVPFQFKENSEFSFSADIDSVNISSFSLDSILAGVKVNDATVKLFVLVSNSIPFEVHGSFVFLDEKGNDTGILIGDSITGNSFTFAAPKMSPPESEDSYGLVTEPSLTEIIIDVDKSEFEKLSSVKKIRFSAALQNNPQRCSIKTSTGLSVQIGVTGQIDAIVDFSKTGSGNGTNTNQNNNNNQ